MQKKNLNKIKNLLKIVAMFYELNDVVLWIFYILVKQNTTEAGQNEKKSCLPRVVKVYETLFFIQ